MRRALAAAVLVFLSCGGANALEDQNEALAGVAELFLHDALEPTFGKEYLKLESLDFSVASLRLIDEYLDVVPKLKGFDRNQLQVILRTGAYVGEVIRRNSKTAQWRWLNYETAKTISPTAFDRFGKIPATAAVLYNGKTFAFPLAKVQKRLTNGPEDSLQFYGSALVSFSR